MKRFQKTVSLFAVALGLTASFAFTASAKKPFITYWFDTTAAGVPTSYNASGPQCTESAGDFCSKEYNANQLNFSGGVPVSVISGQENHPLHARQKGQ